MAAERKHQTVELRMLGFTYQKIAEKLGVSVGLRGEKSPSFRSPKRPHPEAAFTRSSDATFANRLFIASIAVSCGTAPDMSAISP